MEESSTPWGEVEEGQQSGDETGCSATIPDSGTLNKDTSGIENSQSGDEKKKRGRPRRGLSEEDIRETKHKLQMTKLQNEKTALKTQIERFRKEMANLNAINTNLHMENTQAKAGTAKLQAENDHLQNCIVELNGNKADLSNELDRTNSLLHEGEIDLLKLQKVVKNNESEVKTLTKSNTKSLERIKKLEQENNNLKHSLAEVNEKLSETTQSLETSEEEGLKLRDLLKECQTEKNELLEQLDSSGYSLDADSKAMRPKGLVITDSVTNEVAGRLSAGIEWTHVTSTLKDLNEDRIQEMQRADLVVLLTGASDIRRGMKGLEAFGKLKSTAMKLCNSTKVIVAELPPSNQRGTSGHISLFNYKLPKLSELSAQIQFIVTNTKSVLKQDILTENDEMATEAVKMFVDALNDKIVLPATIKTQTASAEVGLSDASSKCKISEFLPLKANQIGRVIGQRGSTITSLTKKYDVTMRIGHWVERSRDRKETEQKTDGVLVTGLLNNVMSAAENIKAILSRTDFMDTIKVD